MRYGLLALALVVACVPVPPPAVTPRSPTSIAASFERTWSATIDIIAQFSVPIKTIDKASGFIVSETMRVDRSTATESANCGTAIGVPIIANEVSYNVRVQGDSTRSTVTATGRWLNTAGSVTDCTTTWIWERAFEDSIRVRAERRPPG